MLLKHWDRLVVNEKLTTGFLLSAAQQDTNHLFAMRQKASSANSIIYRPGIKFPAFGVDYTVCDSPR